MILAIAAFLAIVFAVPLWRAKAHYGREPFSPIRVAATFHLITIVPYLLLVAANPSAINPLLVQEISADGLEAAFLWYGLIQALAFLSLVWGTRSRIVGRLAARLPAVAVRFGPHRSALAVLVGLLVAGVGLRRFLGDIGGLDVLLYNLDRRTSLTAGAGYTLALLPLLTCAAAVVVYSMRYGRSPLKCAVAIGLVILTTALLSSFGGRKLTILLALDLVFIWHFGVKRLQRVSWSLASLGLLLVPYFVAVPILRGTGNFAYFRDNPDKLGEAVLDNLGSLVTDLSYVETYVFITNHFHPDNVWWGRTYRDILAAPVPSSVYGDKPPVDDGVYIRTLAGGMRAEPGMPFRNLFYSSWPPETLGAMYMHFWIPGVILGMYAVGFVYQLTYRYMQLSGFTLFSILIYVHVLFSFHLSNLRIVQTVTFLAVTTVYFAVFFGCRFQRARAQNSERPVWAPARVRGREAPSIVGRPATRLVRPQRVATRGIG